jgi:voltage-gated potassium channel
MIMGYGIIDVPTRIVTEELSKSKRSRKHRICDTCGENKHYKSARYCHRCGSEFDTVPSD